MKFSALVLIAVATLSVEASRHTGKKTQKTQKNSTPPARIPREKPSSPGQTFSVWNPLTWPLWFSSGVDRPAPTDEDYSSDLQAMFSEELPSPSAPIVQHENIITGTGDNSKDLEAPVTEDSSAMVDVNALLASSPNSGQPDDENIYTELKEETPAKLVEEIPFNVNGEAILSESGKEGHSEETKKEAPEELVSSQAIVPNQFSDNADSQPPSPQNESTSDPDTEDDSSSSDAEDYSDNDDPYSSFTKRMDSKINRAVFNKGRW